MKKWIWMHRMDSIDGCIKINQYIFFKMDMNAKISKDGWIWKDTGQRVKKNDRCMVRNMIFEF